MAINGLDYFSDSLQGMLCVAACRPALRPKSTFSSNYGGGRSNFPGTIRKVKVTANFSEMYGLGIREAPSVTTAHFRGAEFKQGIILLFISAYQFLVFPISDSSKCLL